MAKISVRKIAQHFGSYQRLAEALGVVRMSCYQWHYKGFIPPARAKQVELLTGGALKASDMQTRSPRATMRLPIAGARAPAQANQEILTRADLYDKCSAALALHAAALREAAIIHQRTGKLAQIPRFEFPAI